MKFLKYLAIVLIVTLFASSCSSTKLYQYTNHPRVTREESPKVKIIPVYIDQDFTESELTSIRSAIASWNHVLNGYATLQIKSTEFDKENFRPVVRTIITTMEGYLIMKVNQDDDLVSDYVERGDGTLAFVNSLGRESHFMFIIGDRIGNRMLDVIVMHELGHMLGSMHTLAKSLMFPSYNDYRGFVCVDKITAAQVAGYWGYDLNRMNYCATPDFK